MLRLRSLFVFTFAVLLVAPMALAGSLSGVVRVSDADTIRVGEVRVRLHGIDALERDQTCTRDDGSRWACGDWASRQLDARFGGDRAQCDTLGADRYDRTLAKCRLAGIDLGDWLVRNGLALAYRRYSLDYVDAEKEALFAQRGIWASDFIPPSEFRAAARAAVDAVAAEFALPPGDCAIKGNISTSGRIYHMPGQRDYDATSIRTDKGERWFCSEIEARAAGWRRARR